MTRQNQDISSLQTSIILIKIFASKRRWRTRENTIRSFSTFINCFNSTSRVCFSVNQNAKTSYIALEANFTSLIRSIKASNLETQQKFKFSIFSSRLNSTSRFCFSVNQIAETPQYQHIEIDKVKSLKSFKTVKLLKSFNSAVIISSFSSTLRFSLSVNHDSLISSRIDFLRVLINQVIYVSITRFSYRFSYQFASSSLQTTIHRCRRRSHMHLNIRVETTLKKREE